MAVSPFHLFFLHDYAWCLFPKRHRHGSCHCHHIVVIVSTKLQVRMHKLLTVLVLVLVNCHSYAWLWLWCVDWCYNSTTKKLFVHPLQHRDAIPPNSFIPCHSAWWCSFSNLHLWLLSLLLLLVRFSSCWAVFGCGGCLPFNRSILSSTGDIDAVIQLACLCFITLLDAYFSIFIVVTLVIIITLWSSFPQHQVCANICP